MICEPLPAVLRARAEQVPYAPFLMSVDGDELTYEAARDGAWRWAAAFGDLGVRDGETVVTMAFNGADAVLRWLGLAWAGGVEAPINTDLRGELLVHAVNLTRARILVTLQAFAGRVAEVADRLRHLETVVILDGDTSGLPFLTVDAADVLATKRADDPARDPSRWDIGAILFTSGTTGPSKAVRMPWAQIHATAIATYPIDDLGAGDVLYSNGPAYHVGAKVFPYIAALVGGSTVLRGSPSLTEWIGDHERFGITTSVAMPALFEKWLTSEPGPGEQRRLRNLLAPYPVPLLAEFKQRFGARSCAAYNMTELSIPICTSSWEEKPPTSCGRLREGYPHYEARIVDANDDEVAIGEVGELVVRASVPWTTNAGYLNMPDASAEAWRNGWFHTGDAMRKDEDGWFYFADRIKDAIRRRGENISSVEVESLVNTHPEIVECAAVAVRMSEAVGADEEVKVVAVRASASSITAEALIEHLIGVMPRFMIPRFVEFTEALPKTPTMKVRKAELRALGVTADTWDREAAGVSLPR